MKRHALVIVLGLLAASGWGILLVNQAVRSGEFKDDLPLGATVARSVGKLAEEYWVLGRITFFRYRATWENMARDEKDDDEEKEKKRSESRHAAEMARLKERFTRHLKGIVESDPSIELIAVVSAEPGGVSRVIMSSGEFDSVGPVGEGIAHGIVTEYRDFDRLGTKRLRRFTCAVYD